MAIVGGLDIHRKQLTFDYVDTDTGELKRGQIAPADREHLRSWLSRLSGRDDVAFGLQGCTGWRYVAEELAAAGFEAHVGEPADTAALRGRETYHDLRVEHNAWVQRIHAVLFHQGAPALGEGGLSTSEGRGRLERIVTEQLSPAGQTQVAVARRMLDVCDEQLAVVRRQVLTAAKQMHGARVLGEAGSDRSPLWPWCAGWAARGGSVPPPARRSGSPDWT
jgi:hypothetical protein